MEDKVKLLDDMNILKKMMNNELQLSEIDKETKIRITNLCKNRCNQLDIKISNVKKYIEEYENLIQNYNNKKAGE